jgi:hypothetical protein
MLVVNRLTACVSDGETLEAKLAFPPYDAVIECEPTLNADVVNVVCPPLSVLVPSVVLPSLKVTAPVGVPPFPLTVAVKITLCS